MNESGDVTVLNTAIQYPKDEGIIGTKFIDETGNSNQKYDKNGTVMTSSVASALDDSTPSDSGVQLMDSISSDMNESFMSNFGFDYDGTTTASSHKPDLSDVDEVSGSVSLLPDEIMARESEFVNRNANNCLDIDEIALTKSDIDNSNVDSDLLIPNDAGMNDIPDEMKTSTCSTFDTDAIVFRRKVRKPRTSSTSSGGGSVKKRVSFHEDILKNTKTDNIHIERGFVTYKGCQKKTPYRFLRNSWCSQGQCQDYGDDHACYRNACSDVLDYGQMDVFDDTEAGMVQIDNSGVFEYAPRETTLSPPLQKQQSQMLTAASNDERGFYNCKCSDSNSSLESNDNTNGNDCKRPDYSRTKSSSCDCIGQVESNKINNNGSPNMTDNCYFSEPCIETMHEYELEPCQPKSVWRKELKPKSSCLKKTVRETSVILEHDVTAKVKKFNVHQLPDVNNLFGSIKNIFSTIPERGVPEGCEDLHNVYECVPDTDSPMKSPPEQTKPPLKLSPDQEQVETPPGSQSKRKPELSLFPFPTVDEMMHVAIADDTMDLEAEAALPGPSNTSRSKFIVNCESTVFEHTGYFENTVPNIPDFPSPNSNCATPQKTSKSILSFSTAPLKQKLGNIFASFRSSSSSTKSSSANNSPKSASTQCLYRERERQLQQEQLQAQLKKLQEEQMVRSWNSSYDYYRGTAGAKNPFDCASSMTSSIISNSSDKNSEMSGSTVSTSTNASNHDHSNDRFNLPTFFESSPTAALPPKVPRSPTPSSNTSSPSKSKTRHLASPLRRKSSNSNFDRTNLSPDLFCGQKNANQNPMILLSEEFDDLLTITTTTTTDPNLESTACAPSSSGIHTVSIEASTSVEIECDTPSISDKIVPEVEIETEQSESDMEVVDYSTAVREAEIIAAQLKYSERRNQFLRPPSTKSSLINRFLRNVTQKKINDITVKKNIEMSNKCKQQPKAFNSLYVKPKKPIKVIQKAIMADFAAEIAQEMQAHKAQLSPTSPEADASTTSFDDEIEEASVAESLKVEEEFGVGVGEISVDLFDINQLHILRDEREKLIKVFKLYTGYNLQGHMTPVLVFLTDKTLYVTDLVRNRLCNKFVLPYSELDVILIGPHGNTVLLSNSARDMQQVLLAGGPYPADGLVSSLEFCARRSGASLPAIGNLTFDHLGPLQKFVNEHCTASKNDAWIYYAVVSVPANVLTHEDEPLGPNIKGPLMHRSLSLVGDQQNQPWLAGYFLLKAGVLYMFADSNKKLPSMVIALSDCKGARRASSAPRPHCFEIMLQTGVLQLAAPDEYVASEWLISVVQSASGLYANQERHKTLGCTLVITSNHLITLREDFSSPLRRLNSKGTVSPAITRPYKENAYKENTHSDRKMSFSTVSDITFNDASSNLSTPSRLTTSSRSSPSHWQSQAGNQQCDEKSFSSISSIYGKNSGVEVKTCAPLREMVSVRVPSRNDQWWCILEFSCQEVRDSSDDMVIFFATNSDMRRFLSILESIWQTKNAGQFPVTCLPENDFITSHGSNLFRSLNRSWEPLISAALGFPQ